MRILRTGLRPGRTEVHEVRRQPSLQLPHAIYGEARSYTEQPPAMEQQVGREGSMSYGKTALVHDEQEREEK